MNYFYIFIIFNICFVAFNKVSAASISEGHDDSTNSDLAQVNSGDDGLVDEIDDDDDYETRRLLYLLKRHLFVPSSSSALVGRRGKYFPDDEEMWMNGPVAKRAFKLLRVGRSINNIAHRLPRMG